MLDDVIGLLTEQMLENRFKSINQGKEEIITMSRTELYQFCIKLLKLIKYYEED